MIHDPRGKTSSKAFDQQKTYGDRCAQSHLTCSCGQSLLQTTIGELLVSSGPCFCVLLFHHGCDVEKHRICRAAGVVTIFGWMPFACPFARNTDSRGVGAEDVC